MEFVLSLTALAIAFVGGLGAVWMLTRGRSDPGLLVGMGVSIVIGVGMVSMCSFVLGLVLRGTALRASVIGVCVMMAVAGFVSLRIKDLRGWARELDMWNALALALILGETLCIAWLSLFRTDLGWDGLFNWESKARVAFLNNGAIPVDFFRILFFHSMYPLLLPLTESWIYGFLGRMDQTQAKLIGPLFYAATLLTLGGAARRFSGKPWGGVLAVILMAAIPPAIIGEGSATSGYADFPLAAIYLCCAVQVVEYWRTGDAGVLPLLGITAAVLPWTKSEGWILLACIALGVIPNALVRRHWKGLAWALAPGLGVALGWNLFLRLVHGPRYEAMLPPTWKNLLAGLPRVGPIIQTMAAELVNWNRWGLLWVMIPVGLLLLRPYKWRVWYPHASVIFLPIVIHPAAFIFTTWADVRVHMNSSLDRLWLASAAPVVLLLATALPRIFQSRARKEALPESPPPVIVELPAKPPAASPTRRRRKRKPR